MGMPHATAATAETLASKAAVAPAASTSTGDLAEPAGLVEALVQGVAGAIVAGVSFTLCSMHLSALANSRVGRSIGSNKFGQKASQKPILYSLSEARSLQPHAGLS